MGHRVSRLDLFVTERCNLACPYCFTAGRRLPDPPEERLFRAIDWLLEGDAPKVHVTFWGGEPLLRLELLRALSVHGERNARARGKRLTLSMPTNATLLDDEALDWIAEHSVSVFCSIDGDESAGDSRPVAGAGGSSFEMAVAGLERALARGPRRPPAVRMTVTPENAESQARGVASFARLGVREVLLYPAFDRPWSDREIESFRRGQLELARLVPRLVREADDPRRVVRVKPMHGALRRLAEGVPRRPREGRWRHCGAGSELVALAVDGAFYPCHRFVFYGRRRGDELRMGELDRELDPGPGAELASLRVEDLAGVARCVGCELYDLCPLGCPAISYAATGSTAKVPASACALVRAELEAWTALHEALAGEPRYEVYLGRALDGAVRSAAKVLGTRAASLYSRRVETRGGHDAKGSHRG